MKKNTEESHIIDKCIKEGSIVPVRIVYKNSLTILLESHHCQTSLRQYYTRS